MLIFGFICMFVGMIVSGGEKSWKVGVAIAAVGLISFVASALVHFKMPYKSDGHDVNVTVNRF